MNRPVWLLDVDGVLNATRPGWSAAPKTAMAYDKGIGWRLRWAPALLDRVRLVIASGLVDVRWCTTWCNAADQLERLFRFPELPRALSPEDLFIDKDRAKLDAALSVVDAGQRLIWTDDDVIPVAGPERAKLIDAGALLIAPKSRYGLTRAHIDEIEVFITVVTREVAR